MPGGHTKHNQQSVHVGCLSTPLFETVMKQFYSEEMLEMICNYGRYTENIFPLAAADGVLACTGLHNIIRDREGGEGGGYHIMVVRHDNVVPGDTGCHNIIFSVLRILMIEPR